MEVLIIVLLLLVFVLMIILTVRNHIKKSERQKYYAAAGNVLREEFLDYSLQNTVTTERIITEPRPAKMMLYLKSKSSGKKAQFVFDPEKEISIGRNVADNSIFINDPQVSQLHCCIYSENDRVYIRDMCSANGTFVKRGMFTRYDLFNGNQMELQTGDKIVVGPCEFSVCLFYYDLNSL